MDRKFVSLDVHWRVPCWLFFLFQLDPKEFAELQQKRAKKLQEVVKLKRMCMNLIDGIMEGYPKSKQKLIEDTEIETDEAAGFDINQYNWTILKFVSRCESLRYWNMRSLFGETKTQLVPFDKLSLNLLGNNL